MKSNLVCPGPLQEVLFKDTVPLNRLEERFFCSVRSHDKDMALYNIITECVDCHNPYNVLYEIA